MKCLVFSDSHGYHYNMTRALRLHRNAEIVFFLGDGLSDVDYVSREFPTVKFLAVRGNCDMHRLVFGMLSEKTEMIEIMGKRIVYTHGDLYGAKYGTDGLFSLGVSRSADIVLFGHTHQPLEKYIPTEEGGIYLFNPGSIGYSYGNSPTYGVINLLDNGIGFSHGSFV